MRKAAAGLRYRPTDGSALINRPSSRCRCRHQPTAMDGWAQKVSTGWEGWEGVILLNFHTQCLGENDENSSKMVRPSLNFACNLSQSDATAAVTGSSVPPTIFIWQHIFIFKSGKVIQWLTPYMQIMQWLSPYQRQSV